MAFTGAACFWRLAMRQVLLIILIAVLSTRAPAADRETSSMDSFFTFKQQSPFFSSVPSTFESRQNLRQQVQMSATIMLRMYVAQRAERYRSTWQRWSIEEALPQILGEVHESFVVNGKIYHVSESTNLKVVEDPVGHYFRITRGESFSAKEEFLTRDLQKPKSGMVEGETHFTYEPMVGDSLIETNKENLFNNLEQIKYSEEWTNLLPFIREPDPKKRVVILEAIAGPISIAEKQFLLRYLLESQNPYELGTILNRRVLFSFDGSAFSALAELIRMWKHTTRHPDTPVWKLVFYQRVIARAFNRFKSEVKGQLWDLDHEISSWVRTQNNIQVVSKGPLMEATGFLPALVLAVTDREVIKTRQTTSVWDFIAGLPWGLLSERLRKNILRFALIDLDRQSLESRLKVAIQAKDARWYSVIQSLNLQSPGLLESYTERTPNLEQLLEMLKNESRESSSDGGLEVQRLRCEQVI
jgi:hypothetical protein